MTLKSYLTTLVLAFAIALPGSSDEPSTFDGKIGLQLYSLRSQFKLKGVDRTLDLVKKMGFQYVELAGTYDIDPAEFRAKLEERGLKAVAAHFPYGRFKNEPEAIATEAKALGIQQVGCAWAEHKAPLDEAQMRDIIATFNAAGKVLAAHDITFYYHLHGFEFQAHDSKGTLADLLITETTPEHVKFQMDVLWFIFPGQDPVAWLKKYPDRWVSMHLKDLKKGVETGSLTGKTDVANDVVLGTGQTDWSALLGAAKQVGVEYYFIEDESPTSESQIPASLEFLNQVKLAGK